MRFIRLGVCALLAFGVAAHGGVEDWARAVFETGAAVVFLAWALYVFFHKEESIVFPRILPPLVVLFLLVFVQWSFRLSASSYSTRSELLLMAGDIIFIFTAAQVFRTLDDWRSFAWFLMIFGFLVSGFGILQHLTFNGKLYWVREIRYGGIPFGPYVNRNHFASFGALVIPMSLVPLMLGKVRRERMVIVGLLAIIPLAATFLSASRGGIISVVAEFAFLMIVLLVQRSVGKHVVVGGAVLALTVLLVSWIGVKQILYRFASLQTLEVQEGKRTSMRHGTWRIFTDHPIIGTGLGTLQIVYPLYETEYDGKIVNHAHNDYLEALAETGSLGGLCCAWFLATLFLSSFEHILSPQSVFAGVLHLAGLTACAGFLVHAFVDFNLHIPANALLFFTMALLSTSDILGPGPKVGRTVASR